MKKTLPTFVKSLCCSFAVITTIILLSTPVIYGRQSREAVYSSGNGFFIEIMRKKISHEQFLDLLYEKREDYRSGELKVVSNFTDWDELIILEDKCGLLEVLPKTLLKNTKLGIHNAISKSKYYMNQLKFENPFIFNQVTLIGEIKSTKNIIRFNTRFGVLGGFSKAILRWENLPIASVEDKNSFWKLRSQEIRKDSNNIDYSKVDYKNNETKVTLRCKIHDYKYTQRPTHHTADVQGCIYCAGKTIKYTEANFKTHAKFFENRKGLFYVVKMSNNDEMFYKIGVTGRDLKYRIIQLSKDYNVSIEHISESTIKQCFEKEQIYKEGFKDFQYTPKKDFGGKTECFVQNPLLLENYYYQNYYLKKYNYDGQNL